MPNFAPKKGTFHTERDMKTNKDIFSEFPGYFCHAFVQK